MAGLTWLHLSDWHQKSESFDRKVVLDKLLKDIENREEISPDLEKLDFVVFNGDAAFKAQEAQYAKTVEDFFDPVLKKLGLENDRFFIGPGNHDLDRDSFELLPGALNKPLESESQIQKWLDNERGLKSLLEPFESYQEFAKRYGDGKFKGYADVLEFKIAGKNIALLGLNSALMAGRHRNAENKVDDYGKLIIGEPQLRLALEEAAEADLRIAVAHHSFDWLTEADRKRVEKLLKKECHFILQGHNHTPKVPAVNDTDGKYVIIPAGACYDCRTPSDASSVNAYNFVHLKDIESGQGTVYLRRWNDLNSEWREDTDTCAGGKFLLGGSSVDDDDEPSPGFQYSFDNRPFFVPYQKKGERVVGRKEALLEVRRQLTKGKRTSIGQTAAFQGIGGLGKTQLAVEYAYKYNDEYPNGVIWITADQDIDSQLVRLAKEALWIAPSSEYKIILNAAKQRLKSYAECLIIFDNVEMRKDINSYLPAPQDGLHLLLTSRTFQTGFNPVSLDLLNKDFSFDLLIKESGRELEKLSQEDNQAARDIAGALHGLPLAIEIAGAYLKRFSDASFQRYWETLDSNLKAAMACGAFDSHTQKHEESFYATLQVSEVVFKQAPRLKDILDLLAWSGAGLMGISLMSSLLDADKAELYPSLDMGNALRLLSKDPEKESYEIHRLLGQVRREQSPLPKDGEWVEQVCLRLGDWFQERREDFNDLPEFEAEINHLEQWLELAQKHAPTQTARLTWLRAYPFYHRGQYHERHRLIESALRQLENDSNEDLELKAHIFNDFGLTYSNFGKHKDALEYHEQALEIRRQILGEKHSDSATSVHNIGFAYNKLGKHQKGFEYYEQALKIKRQILGKDHPDTTTSLNNIGVAYNNLGKYDKALEYHDFLVVWGRRGWKKLWGRG